MTKIEVGSGQGMFDVSLQKTGTIENAFLIALANNSGSITDALEPGAAMSVPDSPEVVNKSNLDFLTLRKVVPATSAELTSEGIDYDPIPTTIY